jgi:hypothetical protein
VRMRLTGCQCVLIGLSVIPPAGAPAADLATAANQLRSTQKFSSLMLQHDQVVLTGFKPSLSPRVTGVDADNALTDAWLHIRSEKKTDANVGLSVSDFSTFFQENLPVIIDSSPRFAKVEIGQTSGPIETNKTRYTFNLKPGVTYRVRFSLQGYKPREDDLTVKQDTSFFCRELQTDDGRQSGKCPTH